MRTSRVYVGGWTPRSSRTTYSYHTTIRDTGRGQARTSDFVPRRPEEVAKTYDEIKAEYVAKGRLWEDPDFPARASSLFFRNPPSAWPNIQWKRPHEICSDPQLFVEGASRMDVVQGGLGDCWLLAALACLTSNEQLLYKVIPPDQSFETGYAGIFRFYFWQYGRWVEVLIDDRLPTTHGNQLVYMHSADRNEFWSALVEKAYAKLCGSYEGMDGGTTSEALTDFSGGVVERFQLGSEAPADLFKLMSKAHAKGSLMGCSINASVSEREAHLSNGLIIGHAYSITDVRLVHVQTPKISGHIPMVRIRNPWGSCHEWKGAWSDGSNEWKLVSDAEKENLGLVFAHDGEFWMSFKDFVDNYQVLEICFLGPDSLAEAEEAAGTRKFEGQLFEGSWRRRVNAGGCPKYTPTFWTNPQYRVTVVDPDPSDNDGTGTILVGVMQKERRKLLKEGKDNLSIGYTMYQAPPGYTGTLDKRFFDNHMWSTISKFTNSREVSDHHKLPPGEYVIIPSTFDPSEEADFVLRIFSESANQKTEELDDVTGTVDIKKGDIAPKTPEDNTKKEAGRQAFLNLAGEDGEIDAFELQTILDATFTKEFDFDGFSTDMTRSMVAMIDTDLTGKIGFEEFKILLGDLMKCKRAFKAADTDNSGYFNSYEFKAVLNTLGFRISNATFNAIVMRYSDKDGYVRFDDFVACYIKLKTMFETFNSKSSSETAGARFLLDEFLMLTMYS